MKRIVMEEGAGGVVKTALLQDGKLVEALTDDPENLSGVGNIYAGTVINVTAGGFAFVDIGLRRTAFLYLSDPRECGVTVKAGQVILAQVLKDAQTGLADAEKGACVTTRLSLTGRFVIAERVPNRRTVSVSKKIENEETRTRLKKLFSSGGEGYDGGYSVICRTDAELAAEETILAEFRALRDILRRADGEWTNAKPPALLYGGGDYRVKAFLELYRQDADEVTVNTERLYSAVKAELAALPPQKAALTLYNQAEHDNEPLFDNMCITPQLNKLKDRRVWLNCGGFIIIEKTEALTVIDVNSGKYTGKGGHDETALRVNLEAAEELAAQLRKRNISGIIIVDFIDMKNADYIEKLTKTLKTAVSKDRVSVNVVGMTELGLMQITRKKTRG